MTKPNNIKTTLQNSCLNLKTKTLKTAKVEVVCPDGKEDGSSSTTNKWTLSKVTKGLGSKIMCFKIKAIPSASKSENKHSKAILLMNGFL